MTSGNHPQYRSLERKLSDYFASEDALVVPGGYLTNLVVAQAVAGQFSHALLDQRCHPALADAARFLECPILRFKHRDPQDFAVTVNRCGPGARILALTDGMFSHNGSTAPLREYLKALPRDGMLLVDDAHGAGVLGEKGRGTVEYTGVARRRVLQTVTLSKAFGCYGGAILCGAAARERMMRQSQAFIGSTPSPLPLVGGAIKALSILSGACPARRRLHAQAAWLRNHLRQAGFQVTDYPGPIVRLTPKSTEAGDRLERALLARGIFPPRLKYLGGAANVAFRFVLSSEHTKVQLRAALSAILAAADPAQFGEE